MRSQRQVVAVCFSLLAIASGAFEQSATGICTSGSVLLQHASRTVPKASFLENSGSCDESLWPDKDHDLVCGSCKVLVNHFKSRYGTCDSYCDNLGLECVGAWEEKGDTCEVDHPLRCDETIDSSDAICQCSAGCYGEFDAVVQNEGSGIGVPKVATVSPADCKSACDGNSACKSFSLCPQYGGCWMKDRILDGTEPTVSNADCKTYYKKSCSSAPSSTAPSPSPTAQSDIVVRVVSYNLFWWNAFGVDSWKSEHVLRNIKDELRADTLGLQECDQPSRIQERTGYIEVSPFRGAQGLVVKPGVFTVLSSGSHDIQATGKWGPRYVTWAHLLHQSSGHSFWHFNTHWCVHDGNGHVCDSNKRYVGAQNMLNVIAKQAGAEPVVITGDFNAHMGERGPQHFMNNGFTLAVTEWVDAIFYSTAHWEVVSTSKGSRAHSDHRPVIAELQLLAGL